MPHTKFEGRRPRPSGYRKNDRESGRPDWRGAGRPGFQDNRAPDRVKAMPEHPNYMDDRLPYPGAKPLFPPLTHRIAATLDQGFLRALRGVWPLNRAHRASLAADTAALSELLTVNRAEKKATRYYMDEFHLLLKEEQTAAYSVEIWKRFRKWGGIPTAITQNVKDLLSSREVENIFENSDFVLMLNQAAGDRAILAKQLNISPQQMKYVTHSEAGEGLIFYGNVVLPFIDRFPKDTELYKVMTTKPEEVAGA